MQADITDISAKHKNQEFKGYNKLIITNNSHSIHYTRSTEVFLASPKPGVNPTGISKINLN